MLDTDFSPHIIFAKENSKNKVSGKASFNKALAIWSDTWTQVC